MKDVEKIKPTGLFTNYIFKAIPLAFDESMSYYETLCSLLSYLKDTVIPTLNNNADAIIEVQNLMTQLQNYVNNYFTNLDVQQEINNKLDNMVKDGSLTTLIANYINPYINEQNNRINLIDTKVNSISSGSPKGVYNTLNDLQTADPDHNYIYVVTQTGNWYYYNDNTWISGGTYQGTTIPNNSINYNQLNNQLKNTFNECYLSKQKQSPTKNGFFKYSTGQITEHNNFMYEVYNVVEGEKYYISSLCGSDARLYVITDNNDNVLTYDNNTEYQRHQAFIEIPKNGTKLYVNSSKSSSNLIYYFVIKCNKLKLNENYPLKDNYIIAYIDANNGNVVNENMVNETLSDKSIVNLIPIKLNKGDIIYSKYPFTIGKYSEDGTFINRSDLMLYSEITENAYYRINLFNYDNKAIISAYNNNSLITDYMSLGLQINRKDNHKACYLHISFDDVYLCLQDITTNANNYNSIFDNNFFADLKDLHEKYGCVFTLNTFNTRTGTTYDISNTTTKFKAEFNFNSDWLKFSFHAEDNQTYYNNDNNNILISYNKFVTSVLKFATYNCIDNFIRLGFFTGNSNNIDLLLQSNYRPHGLFTADDERISYYLTQNQQTDINNNLYGYDNNKNLYLIKSQTRLENLGDNTINLTSYNSKYMCEIFTHEQQWNETIKSKLETILHQAIQLNYQFIYFEDLLQLKYFIN